MLFLGGNEHSVKVSSNFEMVRAGVLFENFGGYRELILTCHYNINDVTKAPTSHYYCMRHQAAEAPPPPRHSFLSDLLISV